MARKSDAERFQRFIRVEGSCHIWQGATAGKGYGVFGFNGGQVYAHRFSYQVHKGEIPRGLVIDHLCRKPACVNPEHLEAVTPGENIRRGLLPSIIKKQKAAIAFCPKRHAYSPENTYVAKGKRYCKTCMATSSLSYAARNRERRKLAARQYRAAKRQSASAPMDMR